MKRESMKSKKAFTMLELMIVVSVIGILAAVLLPRMFGAKDRVRDSSVESNLISIKSVAERLIDDYNNPNELASAILRSLDGEIQNPYSGSKGVLFVTYQDGISAIADGTQTDFHGFTLGRTDTEVIVWDEDYTSPGGIDASRDEDNLASALQIWINAVSFDANGGSEYYFASDGNQVDNSKNSHSGNLASQGSVILTITKREDAEIDDYLWGTNMQINLYAYDGKAESMTSRDNSSSIIQIR